MHKERTEPDKDRDALDKDKEARENLSQELECAKKECALNLLKYEQYRAKVRTLS